MRDRSGSTATFSSVPEALQNLDGALPELPHHTAERSQAADAATWSPDIFVSNGLFML